MQPVTVAITNFNGTRTILETIESARSMAYPVMQFLLVDDGSTDDSVRLVEDRYPDVRVVAMPRNTGRLNIVRNAALRASATRLVFLVDNDVTFHPESLGCLVEAMESLPMAAICTPRILQSDDRMTIYGGGHLLHYLCVSSDRLRGTPARDAGEEPHLSVGGGIQLIDREALASIGLFNEDFALGWADDGELHHRVNLSGQCCYSVPRAIVYHSPRRRDPRVFGQVHNRWLTLLQSYSVRSMVLLAPALLAYELMLVTFLLYKGQLAEYGSALRAVVANRSRWRKERRRIQSLRARRDRELLTGDRVLVPNELLGRGWEKAGLRLCDALFTAYWRGISWLV